MPRNTSRTSRTSRPVLASLSLLVFAAAALFSRPRPAAGYVEVPYTIGRILGESTNVVVMRVEAVDKTKNTIVYKKVKDLKGTHPGDTIKHNIAQAGFEPREWQNVMAWAEPGKTAVFFHNGSAGECCIDGYWYQIYPGEWWNMSHAEPFMLRSYAGKPDKLAGYVEQMLAGQEVAVPCMVDGDKNALKARAAKLQRMKASLKIQDYDAKRDFAGWGVEEFRVIAGMPAFSHVAPVARTDPGAGGVSPADVDGDGKPDFLLWGTSKVALLHNGGGSLDELRLPVEGGARAAGWADYNGDGKPDLFLATPTGPKLLTNLGGGNFRDDSAALPRWPYFNLTAASWLDYDGDGKPDLLVADGFQGLRLWKNIGGKVPPPLELAMGKWMQCGPFDNTGGKGFDTPYPPEQKIDFKAEYKGKNGVKAIWKDSPVVDGQITSIKIYEPADIHAFMTTYQYREIKTNRAIDLPLSLGNGGPLTVWLNGEKALSENVERQPAQDQTKVVLKLRPGKNDLLIKASYTASGRSFYCAPTPPDDKTAVPQMFEDVSDSVGLGTGGIGGGIKGDCLLVSDLNGDGRPDFVFSAGTGVVALNTPRGFVEVKDSGLKFKAGKVTPVLVDLDGNKRPSLFVPQKDGCKLYRNDGTGRFVDVTAKAGALAALKADSTCAAWVDLEGKGRPGLLVGCVRGPDRYFRQNADGTFADAGDDVGTYQKIFNTRGIGVIDFNNDGAPDLVLNNEGQESALLLGRPAAMRQAAASAR